MAEGLIDDEQGVFKAGRRCVGKILKEVKMEMVRRGKSGDYLAFCMQIT